MPWDCRWQLVTESTGLGCDTVKHGRITIAALVAVAATLGILWLAHGPADPVSATWSDVEAEAQRGGYRLISTDELWARYQTDPKGLLLVDTRQEWEYRAGHIKGAVNFPMEPTWLARWRKKGELEQFIGQAKERSIVFY